MTDKCGFSQLREADQKRMMEWGKDKTSLSFKGLEMAGECGEACNVIKKLERERMGLVGSRASLEDLADELADVVICVDLICADMGIDLLEAVKAKFNKTSEKYNLQTRM